MTKFLYLVTVRLGLSCSGAHLRDRAVKAFSSHSTLAPGVAFAVAGITAEIS